MACQDQYVEEIVVQRLQLASTKLAPQMSVQAEFIPIPWLPSYDPKSHFQVHTYIKEIPYLF